MPTVVITGANGFVGSYLAKQFHASGWNVVALQRYKAVPYQTITFVDFEIGKPINEALLPPINLLIHCAWQPYNKSNPNAAELNLQSVKYLQQLAHKTGAKFVFLSTLSAHDASISEYGKTKHWAETLLDYNLDLTLKLGLVIGSSGGFIKKVGSIIKRFKFIPVIDNGQQQIQVLYIEDLFKVLLKSYEKRLCGNFAVAETGSQTTIALYKKMAKHLNCNPIFVNIPYGLMYRAMLVAEKLLPLPVTTENLKGMKQFRAFSTIAIQQLLEISLTNADSAIEKAIKK
ncbi:MAG: NAD(P)-dependent oxidoreductase [Chitinophagales bacterium]|nr:NAD(P)-dependent oxidoreductase [Chitinophagales bacterium]